MSEVRNGKQKGHKYLYSEIFYGGHKLHKYLCYLRVRGTSLLTYSHIGELRNGRKFKCANEPLIVFILMLEGFCLRFDFKNSIRIYSRCDEFDVA